MAIKSNLIETSRNMYECISWVNHRFLNDFVGGEGTLNNSGQNNLVKITLESFDNATKSTWLRNGKFSLFFFLFCICFFLALTLSLLIYNSKFYDIQIVHLPSRAESRAKLAENEATFPARRFISSWSFAYKLVSS